MIIDDYRALIESLAGGRPVIIAFDNGPRPQKPYAVVYLNLARPTGAHVGKLDEDGARYVESHRPGRLLVHCYGDQSEAFDMADTISLRLMTDAAIDAAAALNIAWMGQPTLESIPALMDNGDYEDRAILTVETAYTGSIFEDVGFFDKVQIEASTEPAASGPSVIDITVDLSP